VGGLPLYATGETAVLAGSDPIKMEVQAPEAARLGREIGDA